jgi:hypothetical protein
MFLMVGSSILFRDARDFSDTVAPRGTATDADSQTPPTLALLVEALLITLL